MAIVEISWERYDDAKPNLAKRAHPAARRSPRPLLSRPGRAQRRPGQGGHRRLSGHARQISPLQRRPTRTRLLLVPDSTTTPTPATHTNSSRPGRSRRPRRPLFARHHLPPPRRKRKVRHRVRQVRRPERRPDRPASTPSNSSRKHPEVAAESVVWHAHDLTGDPIGPAKVHYTYIPGGGI